MKLHYTCSVSMYHTTGRTLEQSDWPERIAFVSGKTSPSVEWKSAMPYKNTFKIGNRNKKNQFNTVRNQKMKRLMMS